MIPENMTLDELIVMAAQSPDPLMLELCRRMKPPASYSGAACNERTVRGRTVLDVIERDSTVVIRFTDGAYFVIDGEADEDGVLYTMGRKLTKSERFGMRMMTDAEVAEYLDEQRAQDEAAKASRIEKLKKELAQLEEGK